MELNGWNGKQVADALYISASKVSRALALLDLPVEVQSRSESGEIPRTSAYELSKLENASTQRTLAEEAATGSLTQRRTAIAAQPTSQSEQAHSTPIPVFIFAGLRLHRRQSGSRKVCESARSPPRWEDGRPVASLTYQVVRRLPASATGPC